MTRRKVPLWKRSCIENLMFEHMQDELDEIGDFEDEYQYSERREDFEIFFGDVSAKAMQLCELFYDNRYLFDEDNGFNDWNDLCVVLFGGERSVLGYDVEERDYYSLFNNGCDCSDWAIDEARKRVMRYTKEELIKRFQCVMLFITTYYDVKSAYDALTGALDYLENDGLKKSEELTENFERHYSRLKFIDGKVIDWDENTKAFDKEVERFPQRWWCE